MGRDGRSLTRRGGGGRSRSSRTLAALVCLGLLLGACSADGATEATASRKGVKGGTLRARRRRRRLPRPGGRPQHHGLGPDAPVRTDPVLVDSSVLGDDIATPVPDLASGPPAISDDGLTYTITLRRGVAWAQPLAGEVRADDFIYAVERQVKGRDPLNPYAWMIKRRPRLLRRQNEEDQRPGRTRPAHGAHHPHPAGPRLRVDPRPALLRPRPPGPRGQVVGRRRVLAPGGRLRPLHPQGLRSRQVDRAGAQPTGTRAPTRCARHGWTRSRSPSAATRDRSSRPSRRTRPTWPVTPSRRR